jgi:two-component system response regulator TctD
MRVLLIEDNERLMRLTQNALATAGFEADGVASAGEAMAALKTIDYSAIVLDLGLPDEDGMVLLKRLRAEGYAVPILILTARGGIDDRVLGLDAGADDYLVKPFSQQELQARLRVLLRRPGGMIGNGLTLGNVHLNTGTRELTIGGKLHFLPPREVAILELLLRRAGRVVAKAVVEDQLFGLSGEVGSNAVEVYVHRLRRDLSELGADVQIHTIRGVGYLIAAARE